MVRRRVPDRLHNLSCYIDLCVWDCICWCHEGVEGRPTLPSPSPIQDVIRFRASATAQVEVTLLINEQPLLIHTFSVTDTAVSIDPGPLSIRPTDVLRVTARIVP